MATIDEIVEKLQAEVETARQTLNTRQPIACTHQLCPDCTIASIERAKEDEMLMFQIREKEELINNLISTQ